MINTYDYKHWKLKQGVNMSEIIIKNLDNIYLPKKNMQFWLKKMKRVE